MSWLRGQWDTQYSEGEITLFKELQARHLTLFMASHRGIKLNYEEDGVHGCEPDFLWGPPGYAVFLDGDPHKTSYRARKDRLITEALERRGFTVDRFRYRTPLSKREARGFADQIERVVRKL